MKTLADVVHQRKSCERCGKHFGAMDKKAIVNDPFRRLRVMVVHPKCTRKEDDWVPYTMDMGVIIVSSGQKLQESRWSRSSGAVKNTIEEVMQGGIMFSLDLMNKDNPDYQSATMSRHIMSYYDKDDGGFQIWDGKRRDYWDEIREKSGRRKERSGKEKQQKVSESKS